MPEPRIATAFLTAKGELVEDSHPEAMFAWWSITKTAIAACLLELADRGMVELDASLPGKGYTPRHLVTHQAGVPNYTDLVSYRQAVAKGGEPWPAERMLREVNADRLRWPPGKGWAYSNTGYFLLRRFLEEVSGQPLDDLLGELVLQPLGLTTVRLAQSPDDMAALTFPGQSYHPGWVYHGCLIGSAADAARMMHGVFTGSLLSPERQTDMLHPAMQDGAIDGRIWTKTGYGCGTMLGKARTAGRIWGHAGCGPFSAGFAGHFPDLGCPVAAFCDIADETPADWAALNRALAVSR
jgi:CubicO group peptidase (beta-lactamase class C family)